MQCQGCGYPLWSIAGRTCPECGRDFQPSDFTFTVNAVRFCCPHCDIAYYGTDEHGQLVPRAFTCVQCHQPIDVDQMVIRPREDLESTRVPVVEDMPWLDRSGRGLLRRLFGTIGLSMGNPGRIMRATPADTPAVTALIFALVMHLIAFGFGAVLPVSILMLLEAPDYDDVMIMLTVVGAVVAGLLLLVVVWGGIVHGILLMTGGAAYPLRRTYQAMLFSSGPVIVAAVPCFGPYMLYWAAVIWWSISAILMLMIGQKVSGVRAALAVLGVPLVLILGTLLLAVLAAIMGW